MRKLYLLGNFGLAVILAIFINQQALATTKEDNQIPQLSDIQLPHRTVKQWLAQQKQSTIPVTGIKLNQTASGLEVILETTASDKLQVTTKIEGNNFIANIPNAQLRLASGNTFRQEKPVAGITEIVAVNQDANSIQITVVGTTQIPNVELFDSDEGLVLGVTPTTPETQPSANNQKPSEPDIELTVTAQKRSEDAQNVPLSLTVIPQQELEDAQISSFSEIANNTPNFSFFPTSSGGAEFNYYSMRGLSNFNFLASQDSVAFYIDDVPFDYGGFLDLGLIDLQQVEVLRGPQSTLYGRSSPGGVVNIISRQPTDSPEMRFSASYGNYNSREVQLSLSNAVIPDKLGFRFAGVYSGRDGLVDNVFLDRTVGERSQLVGRAQFLWTPTPEWNVSFNTYANYTDSGNPTFVPRNSDDPFKSEQTVDGHARVSSDTQALKVNYDGAGFQVTSITARRFTNQDNFLGDNVPQRDFLRQIVDINSTVWSQEIRFQSPESANRLRWLLGGYYESREFNAANDTIEYTETGATAFGLFSPGRDRLSAEQFRNTHAVFGQLDYKPIEPLTLFAGLRYESSNLSLDRRRVYEIPNGGVIPSSPELRGADQKSDEWIPRFGLQYQFNPNLLAYGTISKGYRPSGFNYRADTEDTRRYGEEKSWTYEIGLKSSWLDNRLTANLSVFHTNVDGYQILLADNFGFFRNVANADVNITGVEFEIKATPVQGLDLIGSVGYVDSRFQDYTNPFTGANFSDNRVPLSPEFTYNLAAQYRSPGGIFARLELRGYGTNYFDDANAIKQDPFALVNARIGYEGPNYGIYLYANNLFDTRYITSGFFFPPPNVTAGFGDPVTYGVQVRANL
ncbi:ligand-gated channel [Westiellopsis prolifica IICB1]|nr:ligand-gated channel [Westiellopsis prolifica IICB1]